jgi:hypothetical protein
MKTTASCSLAFSNTRPPHYEAARLDERCVYWTLVGGKKYSHCTLRDDFSTPTAASTQNIAPSIRNFYVLENKQHTYSQWARRQTVQAHDAN